MRVWCLIVGLVIPISILGCDPVTGAHLNISYATPTPMPTPTPTPVSFSKEFTVGTREPIYECIDLKVGNRVTGDFTIQGGSGADVNFGVYDPFNIYILQKNRAQFHQPFGFTASQAGEYCLAFDNSFSYKSNKFVKLQYTRYWQ